VVSVILQASDSNPGNALIPKAPQPTPIPTVTVYATPSATPSTNKG